VLNPDNHVLIPNVQCRAYLGGHNGEYVEDEQQVIRSDPIVQPSIIVTLTGLKWHEQLSYPLSFCNIVPGQVDLSRPATYMTDPFHQNFPESEYYAGFVYSSIYGDQSKLERYNTESSSKAIALMTFQAAPKINHLAMRGYHIRFNYRHGIYSHEVMGNGHRQEVRLNRPGAAAFLSGITAKLESVQIALNLGLS
jgi:hypothetical protein